MCKLFYAVENQNFNITFFSVINKALILANSCESEEIWVHPAWQTLNEQMKAPGGQKLGEQYLYPMGCCLSSGILTATEYNSLQWEIRPFTMFSMDGETDGFLYIYGQLKSLI